MEIFSLLLLWIVKSLWVRLGLKLVAVLLLVNFDCEVFINADGGFYFDVRSVAFVSLIIVLKNYLHR